MTFLPLSLSFVSVWAGTGKVIIMPHMGFRCEGKNNHSKYMTKLTLALP